MPQDKKYRVVPSELIATAMGSAIDVQKDLDVPDPKTEEQAKAILEPKEEKNVKD